jgi:hypothetical protein
LIWISVVSTAVAVVTPGALGFLNLQNPIALSFLPGFMAVGATLSDALFVLMGVASLIVRFRRSRGDERQQLKWFVYSGALTAVLLCTAFGPNSAVSQVLNAAYFLALTTIPASIAIAITKYRLWDIDVLINRTFVYGAATISLVGVYMGSVVVFQDLLRVVSGQRSNVAVAASTLLVAILFTPWRRRLQVAIDRRFYRRRYDAVQALEALSNSLRDDADLDHIQVTLVTMLGDTMQPAHVSLWTAKGKNG